jgi:hypothetical protein
MNSENYEGPRKLEHFTPRYVLSRSLPVFRSGELGCALFNDAVSSSGPALVRLYLKT